MTDSLSRQFATGLAAFFVTMLLILASAPAERSSGGASLDRGGAAAQIRAVLMMHG